MTELDVLIYIDKEDDISYFKYCLRSIAKFFPESKIIILGPRPPEGLQDVWYHSEMLHPTLFNTPETRKNRYLYRYLTEEVSDHVEYRAILFRPWQILCHESCRAWLNVRTAFFPHCAEDPRHYVQSAAAVLESKGLGVINYCADTPYVIDRMHTIDTLREFGDTHCLATCMFNRYPDAEPLYWYDVPSARAEIFNPSSWILRKRLYGTTAFLSVHDKIHELDEWLAKTFPVCKYEVDNGSV